MNQVVPTTGGLSTGEGLIWEVRDPITKRERVKPKGGDAYYEEVEVDPGVTDKRLLVVESEFARTLQVKGRERNTLSTIMRQAWDKGDLRAMVKSNPYRVTGAHICIVAHITKEELLRVLDPTDISSGFVNRFLWVAGKRSKLLPKGGHVPDEVLDALASRVRKALDFAQSFKGEVAMDVEAEALWVERYARLSEPRPGLLGHAIARSEAQVLRLAVVYALLDCSATIERPHLQAALAFWDYCEASARWLFGDKLADPKAEAILMALRTRGPLSRSQIYDDVFQRHVRRDEIADLPDQPFARAQSARCWYDFVHGRFTSVASSSAFGSCSIGMARCISARTRPYAVPFRPLAVSPTVQVNSRVGW